MAVHVVVASNGLDFFEVFSRAEDFLMGMLRSKNIRFMEISLTPEA